MTPIMLLDVPSGPPVTKRFLLKEYTAALDDTYRFPDTRICVREHAPEDVSQDTERCTPQRSGLSSSRLPSCAAAAAVEQLNESSNSP